MKLSNLNINKKLGLIAILIGILALFMPDPMKSNNVLINTKNISQKINSDSKVSVADLADFIIKGNNDFILIDLSDSKSYNEYHIPPAVNLNVNEINSDNVAKNQKVILYSNDNLLTAQAWFLMKSQKYISVYMLDGGLDSWKSKILFPVIPDSIPIDKISEFEKIKEACKFFGGQPQSRNSNVASGQPALSMPKLSSTPAAAPSASTGKKPKKDGC